MNGAERADYRLDSRDNNDRREFGWRTVIFGYLLSRRRTHRRSKETDSMFIDWHHPWLFFLATGIMLLSSLDAFLTLRLIERGAVEVNPVMDALLGHGHSAFAIAKMLLTGFGILMLVSLSRSRLFNFIRASLLLTAIFSFYACLVCYEFLLMLQPH